MTPPVLELRGVSVKGGDRVLLNGLDLAIGPGERVVAFGPAGSGKHALLKLAAGVVAPDAGEVRLGAAAAALPCPVGYAPNEGGLLNNLTLEQNVILPALYHRTLEPEAALARARAILGELGVGRDAGRRPELATAGARRLAHLARALLVEPALFVLEDPLDDLDAVAAQTVSRLLERLRAESRTVLLATGSLKPYLDWGGRFLLVLPGKTRLYAGKEGVLREADPAVRVFMEDAWISRKGT